MDRENEEARDDPHGSVSARLIVRRACHWVGHQDGVWARDGRRGVAGASRSGG